MDSKSEFASVYDYVSPPIMPGIRHLCGAKEEHARVMNFPEVHYNYDYSKDIDCNNKKCTHPMMGVEGFGHMSSFVRFLFRLIIFCLVLALCYYLYMKLQK